MSVGQSLEEKGRFSRAIMGDGRYGGRETIQINLAEMGIKCAQPIVQALSKVVEEGVFSNGVTVTPKAYDEAIINWYQRRYDWKIDSEDIIYANGSCNGLKEIILAFTEPGDGVIIQRPVCSHYTRVVEGTGRKLETTHLKELSGGRYRIDWKGIDTKARLPTTKLIIICQPHDPIGQVWTTDDMHMLRILCDRHHLMMIVDETRCGLTRQGKKFWPTGKFISPTNLITITSVCESFNIAGLQGTNLIVKDPYLRDKLNSRMSGIMPTAFTMAAVIAAYNESEEWLDEWRAYLDETIDWVTTFMAERMPKVVCFRPEGTSVLWLDFRKCGLTTGEIHRRIYQYADILLEWGAISDAEFCEQFERVSLAAPRSIIMEAFERIAIEFDEDF